MGQMKWIVVAATLCVASGAQANPQIKTVGGFTVQTITRTVDGVPRQETYLLRERSKHRHSHNRSGKRRYPRCRTGLFGRVVNAPCLVRHRYGRPRRGKPY